MTKNILIVSSSPRQQSNSHRLAEAFAAGAERAGNTVEMIRLRGKKLSFCLGCMACQKTKTGHCVQKDDAEEIIQKMATADVIVFASPIYYYSIPGQLKTLLDRANPLYPLDIQFREIYFLSTAADDSEETPSRAIACIEGWIDCFEDVKLSDSLFCGGVDGPNEIEGNPKLIEAENLGAAV